jgi:hypothetical protein
VITSRTLVAAAVAASVLLVGAYLAAGGSGYEPTAVADPCAAREWRSPEGIEEAAQQFFLSALDGAACELDVSREELAIALATEESRQEFAAEQGIGDAELESGVRAGVQRAIADAEAAGALSPLAADALGAIAAQLPVDELIALIGDASAIFTDAGGAIDDLDGLLDQAGGVLP